uniref:Putative secreted salivary protein n=1 Tax=Rhipicephalus pulchellus TaxID=72859 RepID=L7M3R1_RHIPC
MNYFNACFIISTLFFVSTDWQPASNIIVEAGRVIFGKEGCWRYDCSTNECYQHGCECPAGILQLFGIKNCR